MFYKFYLVFKYESRYKKLRDFIERFYPSEPISFHPSKIKVFFMLTVGVIVALFFYLRSASKEEINYLELKHKEIQILVRDYLQTMSRVSYDENKMKELKIEFYESKRELHKIEGKIDSIKNFWFLE